MMNKIIKTKIMMILFIIKIPKKTNENKIIFKINTLNIILLFGMAIAKRYLQQVTVNLNSEDISSFPNSSYVFHL